MARREITVRNFIEMPNGEAVPLESLPPDELERWRARFLERFGRALSEYYSQHPEEYDAVPDLTGSLSPDEMPA